MPRITPSVSSGARVETQIVGYQIHAPLTPPQRIVGFHHLSSEAEDDPGAQSEHPSWPEADPGLLEGTAPSLPPTPTPETTVGPTLTCPRSRSCSCCPRWTRGWPGAGSGWASPQPGQSPCSSGWPPSTSGCPLPGRVVQRDGERYTGWERTERPVLWLVFQRLVAAQRGFSRPTWFINLLQPPASPARTLPGVACPNTHPSNSIT